MLQSWAVVSVALLRQFSIMDYVTSFAVGFFGYINEFLFVTVAPCAWQVIFLALMLGGVFLWLVCEIRGYQASLASWSSLTDDMFKDEMETGKEAFVSYVRWKR